MLKISLSLLLAFVHLHAGGFESTPQTNLLFFGAFAMILVYNLGYYIMTKSATYGTYLLFHITLFIIMLFYTGAIEQPWFDVNVYDVPVGMFFLCVAMLLVFTRDYLELKTFYPKAENYVNKIVILNLGLLVLTAFTIAMDFIEIFTISLVLLEATGLLIFSGFLTFKKKNIYARFYFFSFAILFVTLIFISLAYFHIIEIGQNAVYWFELAILFEAGGFSLAIAYKHQETVVNLRQNEMLFKELSHRVQNNLQQVISILSLQMNNSENIEVSKHLEDAISRISSISLIHKTLQNASNPGKINMHTYLTSLIKGYQRLNPNIAFSIECADNIELTIKKLTHLALILNELITNSVKHAFEGIDSPQINIKLEEDALIRFTYKDNGVGFTEGTITDSLGTKLIDVLSNAKLKAKPHVDSKEHYSFSLEFAR